MSWADDDDELDPENVDYGSEEASEPEQEQEPQLVYPNVHEWVRGWLRFSYKRRIDGKTTFWYARWWQVDEALMRLEALWRAWEHLRLDPGTGMSTWWRDHADHHMPALMAADGPFRGLEDGDSAENTCKRQEPLPHIDAPGWLFPRPEEKEGAEDDA